MRKFVGGPLANNCKFVHPRVQAIMVYEYGLYVRLDGAISHE